MRITPAGSLSVRVRQVFGARETLELSHAAAIRRRVLALLASRGKDPSFGRLVEIVDALRTRYGVEAVCAELPIRAQDYYAEKSRAADLRWQRLVADRRGARDAKSDTFTESPPVMVCGLDRSGAVTAG